MIWRPIIYLQKEFFHPFTLWISLYIIRDFFFGNMFDASWFLGALLVGVPMVWGLSRLFKKDVLVILLPLLVYLYLHYVKELPSEWAVLYDWYNDFKSPNLSFPGGLLWITLGYVCYGQ